LNLDRQQKFHFRNSGVLLNGKKTIFYLFDAFSSHFQLLHHLLFIHPQIFHAIYCMPQVMETTMSFLMLGLPSERADAECFHEINSFVIVL